LTAKTPSHKEKFLQSGAEFFASFFLGVFAIGGLFFAR